MENGNKVIKIELNTDSDGSEEENEADYTRLSKFYYNEGDADKDVDNIFEEVCKSICDAEPLNQRFQNIIFVADDHHKEYVSRLKSDSKNVNVLACKNLCLNELDLLNQESENSLWLIISGIHTVSSVNNLSQLTSPYIPGIKKLSWNMKRLEEFEEEGKQFQKYLKGLLPESCSVVMLPPLPAAVTVNAMNTTKSQKFAEFYCHFIKTISQLTIEMLKQQDLPCSISIKNYLEVEDSVYEIKTSGQDLCVLTVKDWTLLGDWYNILEDITGLKMRLDCPFIGYKRLDTEEGDASSNMLSAACFIRQANLVPSTNIPEIEKLEESMAPCLTKWPVALKALKQDTLPTKKETEYELKIFQNEVYKLQVDKLKEECNVSRNFVVVGEKLAVSKFCNIKIPTVKFHQLYVEDNDYEATRVNIPTNLLRAENTIWILFCDIASSMKKKKISFCERHFPGRNCTVELNMNSLNCSTEKDRCKKLNEFLQKLFPSLGKNSIIIPAPIIPQISLLPASDTFKMEDFHNVVHGSDDLRHLWIFLPSMQKLQIVAAIQAFEKEWWKNIEKIMLMQNFNTEFMLDYKENASQSLEVLENPRLLKVNNKAYEEWARFMKAIITFYIHAIDNAECVPIQFKKEASKGVVKLGKNRSSSTTTHGGTQHQGPQRIIPRHFPPPTSKRHESLQQGMHEDLAIYKRNIYLYDIPKSLNNTALKKILNVCGYVTDFQREVVGGLRAASCSVEFHDTGSNFRAYELLNGRKVLSNSLCVVIPNEKHFTAQEKAFDHEYAEEDSIQIKSILADVSSWNSKSPEHQKIERSETKIFESKNESNISLVNTSNFFNEDISQVLETRYLQTGRSLVRRCSLSPEELYQSASRDLKRRSDRSRSRERGRIKFEDKTRSHRRSRSRDKSRSHLRSRSREKIRSHKIANSRDRIRSQSRSKSRSQERNILKDGISYEMYEESDIYHENKKSHKRRLSPKQNSSSGFTEGKECLALITLSENLGVLAVSFKLLMKSCVETQSIDVLFEEDNMLLLNTIYNKFISLQNSTSDVINVEKFKVGAKICKKLIDTVISRKGSKQIALPPTIPLQLPTRTVQQSVNMLNSSSTLYESTNPKLSHDTLQQASITSHFPSTSRSAKDLSTAEEKQMLHGVDIGIIAKCTLGKDAAAIKNFIKNSLEYVGITPTYNIIYEIFSEVSMIHFKLAMQ